MKCGAPMGENYLTFGQNEVPGYARVGESVEFHGTATEVNAPELVGPIRAACGSGKVLMINGMRSAAAEGAQGRVFDNAGTCLVSLPPPPPPGAPNCPPGTKAIHGMCRTPEGYIRPLPKWVQELIGEDRR